MNYKFIFSINKNDILSSFEVLKNALKYLLVTLIWIRLVLTHYA